MEKCIEALTDELVLREVQTEPECITLHPAFKTVCLNPWSLRLSAGKYRTIDKKSYHQTGSEEAQVLQIILIHVLVICQVS